VSDLLINHFHHGPPPHIGVALTDTLAGTGVAEN
jgi:hypothetical protein